MPLISARPSRRPSPPEEPEENYFISLSDLMVGLLFIFLILFTFFALRMSLFEEENVDLKGSMNSIVNRGTILQNQLTILQDQLSKENLAVRKRLSLAEETIHQLRATQDILTNSDRIRAELLRKIKEEADKRGITIQIDEERGVIRLPNELLFDTGQAVLKPRGEEVVGILSNILKAVLQNSPVAPRLEAIYIEGHTDNQPIHTLEFPDNWSLSTARALNTYKAMIRNEPDLEKLSNRHDQALFGISGYGELRAIGDNSTDDGRSLNRRIDIRFVLAAPKFFATPPLSNGIPMAQPAGDSVAPSILPALPILPPAPSP